MHMTWETVQHGRFSYTFENIYTIFQVEVVSNLSYEFCSCVGISVNNILKNLDTWCSDRVIFFLGSFKGLCIVITQK